MDYGDIRHINSQGQEKIILSNGYYYNGQVNPVEERQYTPNRRDQKKYTQVYHATHKGENYLPFMNRSFISFSFGGKNIEDFNLLASISGDRLQRQGYSSFEDLTSNYTVMDGHFYWGTHYTNHELDFDLATDAITQNELDAFLKWFSAGKVLELILAEHPNRAIQARVKQAPELHLLPFEQKTTKKIAGQEYITSTTLYKGEISLSFVMDEPYWYSKINIFGYLNEDDGIYYDVWTDANGQEKNIFNDPDAIKIALEDNIPIGSMILDSMLLGDNNYANANLTSGAQTAKLENYTETITNGEVEVEEISELSDNARIAWQDNGEWLGALIAGTIMSTSTGIESFAANTNQYFYYAGNAPAKPTIEFVLTPIINENGYISNPKNSYTSPDTPYNVFSFESLTKKELQFTTPSIYTGYNQVIQIFKEMKVNDAWADIRKYVRDQVNHAAAREWANKVIDSFDNTKVQNNDVILAVDRMKYFIAAKNKDDQNNLIMLSSKFIIDSKTGEAIALFKYRIPIGEVPSSEEGWLNYGIIPEEGQEIKEYVGDMIRSNYLIIEDQNQPDDNGNIVAWEDTSDTKRLHSYVITHDVENGLQNVYVKYQNMYL